MGLQAIVADGVHTLQPKELGRHSQLYCVHGVCDEGFEVPLLFAVTAKKTEMVYAEIFGHLKRALEHNGHSGEGEGLRIVLDFEKAAINAGRASFPSAKIEGCAFHLAQAWNRRMNSLGLRQHIHGPTRDPRITWRATKGIVFLPNQLRTELRALRIVPVRRTHPAHQKCAEFLRYMESTWLSGPFKDLWCKWKISTLRTTNLAEAFHSTLKRLLGCEHPALATLIKLLHDINLEAKCLLNMKIMLPDEMKRLRRRDAERRNNVDKEMSRFDGRFHSRAISPREIRKFCSKMSRHVNGRAI